LKIRVTFTYADGFGREIQQKLPAEPGPVPLRDPATGLIVTVDGRPVMTPGDFSPRWAGSGWTVFNNKAQPVRHYEPFFTATHRFEFDVRIGVSPVFHYDPVERVAATLRPDHTFEKVVFNAWRQETWDANDNVLMSDPKADPDVGDFFRRLPDAEYLPTWHDRRQGGALGPQEQSAARKAAVHAATPTVAHFDPLGRVFLTVTHNKFKRGDDPPADPPTEEFTRALVHLDIEGNEREVIDALGRAVMRYDYDLLGNRIHHSSMEAGRRWKLNDVAGNPLYAWDSRDQQLRTSYDRLRRPAESFLREGSGPELLVLRTVYGESRANPEAMNLRVRVVEIFDQAGDLSDDEYDFKGNLLRTRRRLAREYKGTLDWSGAVPLEAQTYASRTAYDALNRAVELTAPDQSVILPAYNEANLLNSLEANLRGEQANGQPVWTPFIIDIDYDAEGRRTLVEYGSGAAAGQSGVTTTYTYDPFTFRLSRLLTTRPAAFNGDCPQPPPAGFPGCQVQNLHDTYDPSGNVTHVRDDAQQAVYFLNRRVEPSAEYTYDALYRLIEATGREHLGQTAGQPGPPVTPDALNAFHTRLAHPGDGNAMGTYVEQYFYDLADNVLFVRHRGSDPAHPGWTRSYSYNEASQLEPAKVNNRLSSTAVGANVETYAYDGAPGLHGLMTRMSHLPVVLWDYRDLLRATSRQVFNSGTPETTWYAYDESGQRVRKVTERQAPAGQTPTRMRERVYVGGFEVYREYGADGETVELERETLHLMDDEQRVALVETRTQGVDAAPARLIRYQLGNHLNSSTLELDQQAQIVSYEEYTPYGSTSYQAVRSQTETPKRYRYTGKERDEESGLYYHGARYCAPWLARWISADPLGLEDGPNLYCYARANPVRYLDPSGTLSKENEKFLKDAKKHLDTQVTAVEKKIKKIEAAVDAQIAKERKDREVKLKKEFAKTKPQGISEKDFVDQGIAKQREAELINRSVDKQRALLTKLKDLKTFYDTHKFTDDSLLLANVVENEAGSSKYTDASRQAVAYGWLNRTKGTVRAPVGKEISGFERLDKRLKDKSVQDKNSYLEQFKASVAAAEVRIADTKGAKDPTGGATHWISPAAPVFDVKKGGNTQQRTIDGKVRYVPEWARANDDPALTKMKDPKNGSLTNDYKEIKVPNVPNFLFYKGVK
jgi:RHS repeat-associated protein